MLKSPEYLKKYCHLGSIPFVIGFEKCLIIGEGGGGARDENQDNKEVGKGPHAFFHPLLPTPSCAYSVPLFGFLSSMLPCRGCLVTQETNQTVIPDFPQTPKGQWDTFKHQTVFTSDKHWKAPQSVSFPRANLWETLP